jgi:hypothetical protein
MVFDDLAVLVAAGHDAQAAVAAVGILQVDGAGDDTAGVGAEVVVVLVPVGGGAATRELGEELGAEDVDLFVANERYDALDDVSLSGQFEYSRVDDADTLHLVQQTRTRQPSASSSREKCGSGSRS